MIFVVFLLFLLVHVFFRSTTSTSSIHLFFSVKRQNFRTLMGESSAPNEVVELFTIFDDIRRSAIDASNVIFDFIGELPLYLHCDIPLSASLGILLDSWV